MASREDKAAAGQSLTGDHDRERTEMLSQLLESVDKLALIRKQPLWMALLFLLVWLSTLTWTESVGMFGHLGRMWYVSSLSLAPSASVEWAPLPRLPLLVWNGLLYLGSLCFCEMGTSTRPLVLYRHFFTVGLRFDHSSIFDQYRGSNLCYVNQPFFSYSC